MKILRPTVAEIDLGAIAHNLAEVRRLVGPGVKICPAVKADAYGHGAVAVSRVLADGGADMLGVATCEEGIELREAGIEIPILVLQCGTGEEISEIVRWGLSATVYESGFAKKLSDAAKAAGRRVKVHMKVDTGMGRIGTAVDDAVVFGQLVSVLDGLELEGLFTHFACADEEGQEFTREQAGKLRRVVDALAADGVSVPIVHAANSGAILHLPDTWFDMVRPGIMIYGLWDGSAPGIALRPAMTLKTRIVFLKEVPPGSTISYGRTFEACRRTKVATIPVGYADGYSRALSNRGIALVRGKRVPVIGRVCMDQTMLDVTDVPGVAVGDEVVLYGRQHDEEIRIEEVAVMLGTISYEVICAVGKRVPRVYRTPTAGA